MRGYYLITRSFGLLEIHNITTSWLGHQSLFTKLLSRNARRPYIKIPDVNVGFLRSLC